MECKHCGSPINKWSRHITVEEIQAESVGDQPARAGRIVRLDSGVFDSWPCVAGYIADRPAPKPRVDRLVR